ncbi:MAG: hypothetical protein ACYSUF_14850 [Planctomycetota bacterium]|jgi:hypothetical protein
MITNRSTSRKTRSLLMKCHRPWPCLFAALLPVAPGLATQPAETQPAQTPPAATQPVETDPGTPSSRPVVTLLEAGAEPHQLLRFTPCFGSRRRSA